MVLPSGLSFDDPLTLLRGYGRYMYGPYDAVPVAHDSTLTMAELELSRRLRSRLSGKAAEAILAGKQPIEAALALIPDVDLLDVPASDPIPGAAGISAAITALDRIRGVGLAAATKILHPKRPGLLPIFDSVVEAFYWPVRVPSMKGRTCGDYCLALLAEFRRDLQAVAPELRSLRATLAAEGRRLSHVRILDILLWIRGTDQEADYRRWGTPASAR